MFSCTMATETVLPAPSGQYPVGCAHLMHKFEEVDKDTLLVRLFYPCQEGGHYPCAKWLPHERYVQGYNSYWKFMLPESGVSTGKCIWVMITHNRYLTENE